MPLPVRPVIREILKNDVEQPVPDVIRKARAKGVTATDGALREAIYEIKGDLRRAKPTAAPAAAHATKPKTEPAAGPVATSDPTPVLTNIALVNAVVTAAGGVESARKVAEAVRGRGRVPAAPRPGRPGPRQFDVMAEGCDTRWESSRSFGPEAAADLLPHLLPAARVEPQVLVQRDHLGTHFYHPHRERTGQVDREVVPAPAVPLEVDLPDPDDVR